MTEPRFFGTDGMRGRFGEPPLDEATVRSLGAALGAELGRKTELPQVVMGGDTRESTPTLCGWLAGELRHRGVDVRYLGTMTTPGVTATVVAQGAAAGIAVSASHNPFPDNGIKLIDSTGFKYSPRSEARLEELMSTVEPCGKEHLPVVDEQARTAYMDSLNRSLAGRRLDGLKVVLDAGNGAASPFAEDLFSGLGARVTMLHDRPNGSNINLDSGSTHPERLAAAVVEGAADLGVAFDGDADRVVLVDEQGQVRDGDAILYLWARDLAERGELPNQAIVATSMSNLGLEVALRGHGIELVRCGVGDREVVATMRRQRLVLGGEQSGHVVHLGLSTTGDGMLTALQLADLLCRGEGSLCSRLKNFERFPQVLQNFRVGRKPPLDSLPEVMAAGRRIEAALGDEGRLVLRYSGTENLVRVMIEGPDQEWIQSQAEELGAVLVQAIG